MARALVIGASGGIGTALHAALQNDPTFDDVLGVSRSVDGLDITDEGSVAALAARLGEVPFDLIVDATGALEIDGHRPERALKELDPAVMLRSFAINAVGPAMLFKHLGPLLRRDGRAVFATLSARIGSIGDNGLGGWTSYRASKAALNQITRCAALELKRTRPGSVVVALHPGTIETDLTRRYAKGHYTATADEAAAQLLGVLRGLTPDHTGQFFAYDGQPIVW